MIYLCRHGETEFNREGRIQGQLDSSLTPLGRKQARAMADCLAALIDDADGWRLVASPLERTRETAAAISERLGLPVELDARLMEVDVGAWQDRLHKELFKAHPQLEGDRLWCFRAPGGETYEVMLARIDAWLGEQPADGKLIVVSHGVAGRLLRGLYAGLSRDASLAQAIPQDAIFRLDAGRIERLDCEAVA